MSGRKPFLLRMDTKLWDEINSWAQQDMRSVNAQIEYLLTEAVRRRKGGKQPPPQEEQK